MQNVFLVAFLLLLAGVFLLLAARRKRATSGLPPGRVVYSDTSQWRKVEKPLYDPASGLAGKPDYLVENKAGVVIPVEVKSTWAPPEPYENHIMQLAAYCFLVDRTTGVRPDYGILKYRNRTYEVEYNAQIEADLLELVKLMRKNKQAEEVQRTHADPNRCVRCGFRKQCSQRL